MSSGQPLVSIIVPAYNQGHYLAEAIRSCLDQTYPAFELLVVDDGSTDNTREVAQGFGDSRVKYFYQENRGLSAARNTGMNNSRGDLLTFLDSDDRFLPQKLERLVPLFANDPDLGFAAGQAILIDQDGSILDRPFESSLPEPLENLALGNPFHVGSAMVSRRWQEKIGFFDETLRSYEDWDYWLRLAIAGAGMKTIRQPVSMYRFHPDQMTRNGRQMTAASMAVLDKVFARPDLPPTWGQARDAAYSRAHLRSAAHHFLAGNYRSAHADLHVAVNLDPGLLTDRGQSLAQKMAGWTELPKTADRTVFLEAIFNHLPPEMKDLQQQGRQILSEAYLKQALAAYHDRDLGAARGAVRKCLRLRPAWITNRGALAIYLKTLFVSQSL
jgi:glycosyltransferase involved in cell wall biosynthesis